MNIESIRRKVAFWLYPQRVNANEVSGMIRLAEERAAAVALCQQKDKEIEDLEESVLSWKEHCHHAEEKAKQKIAAIDERNIMRNLLSGITLDMAAQDNYLVPLSVEEIRELNKWGWEMSTNRWWNYLVTWAINRKAAETLEVLPFDRDKSMFCAGRVDGIMLLRDEVENRKVAHESDTQKEEPYDEQKIIQDN